MNLMRILVIAVLGMTAAPSYGVPVAFTLEGEPFTAWEFAQRDGARMITSMDVADADGDGIGSFVAEVVPREADIALHVKTGPAFCMYILLNVSLGDQSLVDSTFPFVQNVAGDSLIAEFFGPTSATFSLTQAVEVTNGMIAGLDGLVHVNPGITTAADLLAIDVRTLPTFTGQAEVVGLMTLQVIPEPSSVALAMCAVLGFGIRGRSPGQAKASLDGRRGCAILGLPCFRSNSPCGVLFQRRR